MINIIINPIFSNVNFLSELLLKYLMKALKKSTAQKIIVYKKEEIIRCVYIQN
jgi:hypothetical protein